MPLINDTENMLHIVSNYKKEEMKMIFIKLAGLESALRAADLFYEASIKYAELEARALIRAVELSNGEIPKLAGKNKLLRAEAAVWLYNKTEEERNEIILQCQNGKTIAAIYKELTEPSLDETIVEIKEEIKKEIDENLEKTGTCQLNTQSIENKLSKIPKKIRSDIRDGLRKYLLDKGSVGLNDNQGTYIIPTKKTDKVHEALKARINSIGQDFESFLSIASRCERKPHFHISLKGTQRAFGQDYMLLLAAYYKAIEIDAAPHATHEIKNTIKDIVKTLDFLPPGQMGIDLITLNRWFIEDIKLILKEYEPYEKHMSDEYKTIKSILKINQ